MIWGIQKNSVVLEVWETASAYIQSANQQTFRVILVVCQVYLYRAFFVCVWYAGLSLLWPLSLQSTGSGRAGSATMAHRSSRSAARGIFPDRGTNPCPLHRQADSQPLRHQGSPRFSIFILSYSLYHRSSLILVFITLLKARRPQHSG